jgi:hypothetical protein
VLPQLGLTPVTTRALRDGEAVHVGEAAGDAALSVPLLTYV